MRDDLPAQHAFDKVASTFHSAAFLEICQRSIIFLCLQSSFAPTV